MRVEYKGIWGAEYKGRLTWGVRRPGQLSMSGLTRHKDSADKCSLETPSLEQWPKFDIELKITVT